MRSVLVVESRKAPAKGGPWSEPRAVGLSSAREPEDWCEPYVVSNEWEQSRSVRYVSEEP